MAITIKVEPQTFVPVYNEMILVLDSTNKGEPKFQYVLDININGTFSSRIKLQSNPQGFGIVNIQKHIEGFVSSSLDLADKEAFKKITDSYTKYDIDFSEEYVLTSSFTTVSDNGGYCQYNYPADHNYIEEDFITVSGSSVGDYDGVQEVTSVPSSTSIVTTELFSATATGDSVLSNNTTTMIPDAATLTGDKYALNNVLEWVDVPNWDPEDYHIANILEGDFLTNVPLTAVTRLQDRITFNFYNDFLTQKAHVLKVTSDNNGTFIYDNPFEVAGADSRFLSVGVGAFDIMNAPLSGTYPSSAGLPIDGNTKSYTVELLTDAFDQSSKKYTFKVDQRCNNFEGFRLMYLNKGGSFSTFNFEMQSSKSVAAKKTNFKQNYGSYDSAAVSYGYASSAKGDTRLDTDITETYTINSNYIDESNGSLIQDLLVSPEVYHLSDNSIAYDTAVVINNMLNNNGFVEVQCAAVHGLAVGDNVRLSGFVDDAFNQTFNVLEIINTTDYVIEKPSNVLPFVGGEEMEKEIFGEDGILRAIDLKTSSFKIKKRMTDNLVNYSLKFNYSNKNTVQR